MDLSIFITTLESFGVSGALLAVGFFTYKYLKGEIIEVREKVEDMDLKGTVKLKVLESRIFTEIHEIKYTQNRIEKRLDKLIDMKMHDE